MVIQACPLLSRYKKINYFWKIQIDNFLKLVIYQKVPKTIILLLNFIMINLFFIKKNLKIVKYQKIKIHIITPRLIKVIKNNKNKINNNYHKRMFQK